jgi:hypothetical protein
MDIPSTSSSSATHSLLFPLNTGKIATIQRALANQISPIDTLTTSNFHQFDLDEILKAFPHIQRDTYHYLLLDCKVKPSDRPPIHHQSLRIHKTFVKGVRLTYRDLTPIAIESYYSKSSTVENDQILITKKIIVYYPYITDYVHFQALYNSTSTSLDSTIPTLMGIVNIPLDSDSSQ